MDSYPIPLTLHIGYPRTATKLLQKKLYENNDHILFLGRKVSGKKAERWHDDKLFSCWEWMRFEENEIDLEESRRHILEILTRGAENNKVAAVISEETMCKPHYLNYHVGLAVRLKSLFPNARILLTIRNQIDLIFSLYGLTLRRSTGRIYPLPDFDSWFMNGAGSTYVPVQERFNYARLYSALLTQFGKDDINILFFEDLIKDIPKYISAMSAAIGVENMDLNPSKKINSSPKAKNQSPLGRFMISRGGGLYNVRLIRRYPELLDLFYGQFLKRRIEWDRYKLSDERIRFMNSLFYESNDKFAEMAGLDLEAYGYPTRKLMQGKYSYFKQALA